MNKIFSTQLNLWKNHFIMIAIRTLHEIYLAIKDGAYKEPIEKARLELQNGNKVGYDKIKVSLHAFTTSGMYDKQRKAESLTGYSQLIVLDLDKQTPSESKEIAEKAKMIKYSALVFLSPSGVGIKIIVAVDSSMQQHTQAYKQVVDYYSKELGVKFDEQTKDIGRLCYMSYDPDAYININAEVFQVAIAEPQKVALQNNETTDTCNYEVLAKKFQYIEYKLKEKKELVFVDGKRNNFIFEFACRANKLAMESNVVIAYLVEQYGKGYKDFTGKNILDVVNSVYERYKDQYGTYNFPSNIISNANNTTALQVEQEETDVVELLLESPYISSFVKDNLPTFIKDIVARLQLQREQDVFIIGCLTALSGCIAASGLYRNKQYHSSIFSFISAPPASGKGVLNYCIQLVLPLHKQLKKKSEDDVEVYQVALEDYNQRKAAGEKNLDKPDKPLFKTILIPANSSSAQFVEHLSHNGEKGLMIETEADTLVKMLESDFGNYSDLLRRAFEHEPITIRRKTDKQYIEMFNPQLASCLSGTPNQLSKLITSIENGLFSRINYYVYSSKPQWQDVTPVLKDEIPLTDFVDKIGKELAQKIMEQRKIPMQFNLTNEQWKTLNTVFGKRVAEFSCFVGEEASANIFRLAVSTFRIAMVLTTVRMIEANQYAAKAECSELDFEIAMSLSETFYQHLNYAFKIVKNTNEVLNKTLQQFYDALPEKFDRKRSLEVAKESGIAAHERTLDKYLKRLVDYKFLQKDEYNTYSKKVSLAA